MIRREEALVGRLFSSLEYHQVYPSQSFDRVTASGLNNLRIQASIRNPFQYCFKSFFVHALVRIGSLKTIERRGESRLQLQSSLDLLDCLVIAAGHQIDP